MKLQFTAWEPEPNSDSLSFLNLWEVGGQAEQRLQSDAWHQARDT